MDAKTKPTERSPERHDPAEGVNWYALKPHECCGAVPKKPEDFERTRADIREHGFQPHVSRIKLWRDRTGIVWIIDGAGRYKICMEFGHLFSANDFELMPASTDPWEYSIRVHVNQRQLDAAGKRELIKFMLERFPDDSDRGIARRCCCDAKTVASVKEELAKAVETVVAKFLALKPPQRAEALARITAPAEA